MSVSQLEYVAFKAEVAASAATVVSSIQRFEKVVTKANADAAAAAVAIGELQNS